MYSLLPMDIKTLLQKAPAFSFDMFPPGKYLKSLGVTLKRLSNKKAYKEEVESLKEGKLPFGIEVVSDKPSDKGIMSKERGEKVLEVYFFQIFSGRTVFLDHSIDNFCMEEERLLWSPSRLRYTFSETFLEGVQNLYRGFFFQREDLFDKGMKSVGLVPEKLNSHQREEIKELFLGHFGEALEVSTKFSYSHFDDSFKKLFSLLLDYKVELNPEFAYLGIMLTGLYRHLDMIDSPLSVTGTFERALSVGYNS